MSGILERQLGDLGERFGAVEHRRLPSGTVLVTVPAVPLVGWSATFTSVRFLVPAGYPYAALDCFWADPGLRLATGALPMNAAEQNPIPEDGGTGLWFSWHLQGPWDPNRDTLSSWMNTIIDRLRRAV
jgi:hypothetical protein